VSQLVVRCSWFGLSSICRIDVVMIGQRLYGGGVLVGRRKESLSRRGEVR